MSDNLTHVTVDSNLTRKLDEDGSIKYVRKDGTVAMREITPSSRIYTLEKQVASLTEQLADALARLDKLEGKAE